MKIFPCKLPRYVAKYPQIHPVSLPAAAGKPCGVGQRSFIYATMARPLCRLVSKVLRPPMTRIVAKIKLTVGQV